MPEHRPGTPGEYYVLESFLWREFEDVGEWLEWTVEHKLARTATSTREVFEHAMALRRALRSMEAEHNDERGEGSPVSAINKLIDELGVHPSIEALGGVELIASHATGRLAPVGAVLLMALKAMSNDDWWRFKLCRDPDCRASFYDSTKNGAKTWCSAEGCGSRNKMRRLRERQNG